MKAASTQAAFALSKVFCVRDGSDILFCLSRNADCKKDKTYSPTPIFLSGKRPNRKLHLIDMSFF